MTKSTPDQFASLLYSALAEPIGLLVQCSDLERAKQRLYQARTKLADPALAGLQFRTSPFPGGNLVICKSTVLAQTPAKPTPSAQDLGL